MILNVGIFKIKVQQLNVLCNCVDSEGRVSKRKGKKPLKEGLTKTLKESGDLVKLVRNDNTAKNKKAKWTDKETNNNKRVKKGNRKQQTSYVDERTMLKREKRRLRRAKLKVRKQNLSVQEGVPQLLFIMHVDPNVVILTIHYWLLY